MGVFLTLARFGVRVVNIHAWVSAGFFDDLGFLQPQNTDLLTEIRVFFVCKETALWTNALKIT